MHDDARGAAKRGPRPVSVRAVEGRHLRRGGQPHPGRRLPRDLALPGDDGRRPARHDRPARPGDQPDRHRPGAPNTGRSRPPSTPACRRRSRCSWKHDLSWLGRPFSITAEVTGCQASAEGIPELHREALGPAQVGAARPDRPPRSDRARPWRRHAGDHARDLRHGAVGVLGQGHRRRRNPPQSGGAGRHPLAAPPPAAAGAEAEPGSRRLPDRQLPLHARTATSRPSSTGRWPTSAIRWRTWPGRSIPLWCWTVPELAGRLLPHAEAVRAWEQASGLTVDPGGLALVAGVRLGQGHRHLDLVQRGLP